MVKQLIVPFHNNCWTDKEKKRNSPKVREFPIFFYYQTNLFIGSQSSCPCGYKSVQVRVH